MIDEYKNVYGVEYMHKKKIKYARARKEVIVSAGAINTPQLLMLSGIGPKNHLYHMKVSGPLDFFLYIEHIS